MKEHTLHPRGGSRGRKDNWTHILYCVVGVEASTSRFEGNALDRGATAAACDRINLAFFFDRVQSRASTSIGKVLASRSYRPNHPIRVKYVKRSASLVVTSLMTKIVGSTQHVIDQRGQFLNPYPSEQKGRENQRQRQNQGSTPWWCVERWARTTTRAGCATHSRPTCAAVCQYTIIHIPHISCTVQLTKLCRSELAASDILRRSEDELEATGAWKRAHWREMQTVLRRESANTANSTGVVECCPSVLEMVKPRGGRTPSSLYVELYEDGENRQHLYELSCADGVANRPCRFIDARLYNRSRCVQKYSYSYALVRNLATTEMPHRHRREGHFSMPGSGSWSMDYVQVRAGCECQITPERRNNHRKRSERHRQRKRNRRIEEDEET
ncbi:hypothetical protein EVAR_29859_1 [Eumeta japonica]|uniref:Spaetzle domain-containing protein n=1 Tax=Eumeta variegata TaxID=151549 RepID=A0A4C1VUQ5_EUMVA|nr:hypothetical protein EVAR_29859_1 [Eumeta japonica]